VQRHYDDDRRPHRLWQTVHIEELNEGKDDNDFHDDNCIEDRPEFARRHIRKLLVWRHAAGHDGDRPPHHRGDDGDAQRWQELGLPRLTHVHAEQPNPYKRYDSREERPKPETEEALVGLGGVVHEFSIAKAVLAKSADFVDNV